MSASRKPVIFLVGPTGTGKSSLGNLLCETCAFATSDIAASITKDGQIQGSTKYTVTDNMGLNDTEQSQGRYTQADHAGFLYLFDAILGPSSYRHCIIVITHCSSDYVNPATAAKAQTEWITKSKEQNACLAELFERVQSRCVFICNPKKEEDEQEDSRESKCRRLSLSSLQKTLDQFHTGAPFMMAGAKQAQQAYDAKVQQVEDEKKAAQAKLLEDARKHGEAKAGELHRIEMARIEAEMKAAREKYQTDIQTLVQQKDAEIRKQVRARGTGLFSKIGSVIDTLFGF